MNNRIYVDQSKNIRYIIYNIPEYRNNEIVANQLNELIHSNTRFEEYLTKSDIEEFLYSSDKLIECIPYQYDELYYCSYSEDDKLKYNVIQELTQEPYQ